MSYVMMGFVNIGDRYRKHRIEVIIMLTNVNDRVEHHIYILLTDTGTLFARLIKRFTDAPYNHASIAFDAELKELFSFGRKNPTNPWDVGFVEENVSEGTYQLFP